MFSLTDYTYTLPEELIAQEAIHPHHDARVLICKRSDGDVIRETTFWDLDTYIPSDRVIFLNNSKVLRARIPLKNVDITREDGSSGKIADGEILFCKMVGEDRFEAMVRPGAKFRKNTIIHTHHGDIRVVDMSDTGRILTVDGGDIFDMMRDAGELPLPPYIEYSREKEADYQTSFAKTDGSVAAPTASLHFTRELLEKIQNPKKNITLHVGLGTFKGIDTEDVRDYKIHSEQIEVDRDIFTSIAHMKLDGQKVLAIGTTVCRTLESLPHLWQLLGSEEKSEYPPEVCQFWSDLAERQLRSPMVGSIVITPSSIFFESHIYLYPGIEFLVVDDLITNFHVPESSLLVLVSAFLGKEETKKLYTHAIHEKYRFFSFGDGMYIKG